MPGNNTGAAVATRPANQGMALAQFKPADTQLLALVKAEEPELARAAVRIMASRPANKPLSAARALAAAMREIATGQREGRDFYADEKMGNVDSYRGVARETAESGAEFYTQDRPLTVDEAEIHEIQPGDTAVACEGYHLAQMRQLRASGIPYRPVIGVGIVRKGEKFKTREWSDREQKYVPCDPQPIDPPTGKSWRWKAAQRAYKDALRHIPGMAVTAAEVLDAAEAAGIAVEQVEAANLTLEQAQALVEQAKRLSEERAVLTGEELEQHIASVRGPKTDDPLGIDTPPPAVVAPPVAEDSTDVVEDGEIVGEIVEEIGEERAPREDTPPVHWMQDEAQRDRFLDWARDKCGLKAADVCVALGVEKLLAFTGTKVEAANAVAKAMDARVNGGQARVL